MKHGHENPGGAQELQTVEIVMKTNDFPDRPKGAHRGDPEVLNLQVLARP